MSKRFVVTALAVALVGCARPVTGGGADQQDSSTVGVVETEAADAALIACKGQATLVETPVVRARSDGVHVVIANPGDAWGFEFHPVSFEYEQAMGGDLRGDDVESTWTIAPGEVIVACLPGSRSSYFDVETATATRSRGSALRGLVRTGS